MKRPTSLRITGGSIVTMDANDPVVGEVVTKGGHIAWTGRAGSAPLEYRKARVIDLRGRLLLPAFSDAHTHFLYFARSRNDVDLHGAASLKEALDRIRKHARTLGGRGWITGRGLDINPWKTGWPTCHDLDRFVPDRPVAIFTHDEHTLWANSLAVVRARVTRDIPDPEGGKIARDAEGEPTGVFFETAYRLIWDMVPKPTAAQDERAIRDSQHFAHEVGVAAIGDMGEPATLSAFAALAKKGTLRLRLWKSIPLQRLDAAISSGLRSGMGNSWIKVGSVKVFLDGALGSQTAWMYRPYKSNRSNRGICRLPMRELDEVVRRATAHGLSVCAHAIGDAAVGQAINILAKYRTRFPQSQPPRIEHLQALEPKDLPKLKRSGIIASMQPSHLLTDRDIADNHWGRQSQNAFVFRTLWDSGVVMAFGSDMPIEPINPIAGIGTAVHRANPNDRRGPWHPKERLNVWQAVWGFTVGAAIAAGDQDHRGMIKPGYLADLVILDRNIFTVPPRQIFATNVDATIVCGEIVYKR